VGRLLKAGNGETVLLFCRQDPANYDKTDEMPSNDYIFCGRLEHVSHDFERAGPLEFFYKMLDWDAVDGGVQVTEEKKSKKKRKTVVKSEDGSGSSESALRNVCELQGIHCP